MAGAPGEDRALARMENLSDGVMAFAMTLLVLEVPRPALAPDAGAGAFLGAVAGSWPSLLTLVVSFLYIALYWVNHHHMLRHVRRADHTLLVLNALFLLTIVLVPFATALLAAEFGRPGRGNGAAAVYALSSVLCAASFAAVWAHASRAPGLLVPGTSPAHVRAIRRDSLFGIAWFGVAALVALATFWGAVLMFLLPFLFYALPRGPRATLRHGEHAPAPLPGSGPDAAGDPTAPSPGDAPSPSRTSP